jgi:transglutaminase-like putative cysteine protease
MKIEITHETRYQYAEPVIDFFQTIRLTPQSYAGQTVIDWRIDVDLDAKIREGRDALGNIVHFIEGLHVNPVTVTAKGLVETKDTAGTVQGTNELFSPNYFLSTTDLTTCDDAMYSYAMEARGNRSALEILHQLNARLYEYILYDTTATSVTTTASQCFEMRRGVNQDYTHVFIAMCRALDIPARYVSGYYAAQPTMESANAWAEAWVPDLGWVAFDTINGICTTERHVRVAVGLDYNEAAPFVGRRRGGGAESLSVSVSYGFPEMEDLRRLYRRMKEDLQRLESLLAPEAQSPGLGHNRPPEPIETIDEFNPLLGTLYEDIGTLKAAPEIPGKNLHAIQVSSGRLVRIAHRLQEYMSEKGDVFFSELVKTAGKEAGKWIVRAVPISIVITAILNASSSANEWLQAVQAFLNQLSF